MIGGDRNRWRRGACGSLIALALLGVAPPAQAELPTGYLVWIKGDAGARASRKVYRMTLPDKSDVKALSSGEDVECQISPDGKWVAYAKAKLPDSDYHDFNRFKLYLVSIHGLGDGREEIRIDDNGYWPSWGDGQTLYYSQVDAEHPLHSRIMKATLDADGNLLERSEVFRTYSAFADIREVNECFVAPDASWFAARTRGASSVSGAGAFGLAPAEFHLLARAGDIGCMPYIAPDSSWGFIAGRDQGIRWGDRPGVANRLEDQQLIAPHSAADLVYHPGISTDAQWFMAAHSSEDDHNAGNYDVYLYRLSGKVASDEQLLASGGFNGWPHLWVGQPTAPPPPRPRVNAFYPSSYTILAGESSELFWLTSYADSVTLDGAPVAPDGSQVVSPTSTHTYTLQAASAVASGSAEHSVELTVNQTPQAVAIESFVVEPNPVIAGNTALLSWRVVNAYTLDLGGTPVAPIGSSEVSPIESTTYTLTAQGHQGPASASVTLEVKPLEELHPLLPDRGGCLCPWSSLDQSAPGFALLMLLGLLRRRRDVRRQLPQSGR